MARFLNGVVVLIVVLCMESMDISWCTSSGCLPSERRALLKFKQGLIDPSNRLSSWVGQDCCTWKGIGCNNKTGHVVKLDLHNPFIPDLAHVSYDHYTVVEGLDKQVSNADYWKACLVGREVSPSLLELKHLNHLDLSFNNFSGVKIPNFFGSFHELTYLNLSSAWFSGIVPHHLGNLSSLHSLDLSTHHFRKIHSQILYFSDGLSRLSIDNLHWMTHLSSLQQLDMSGLDFLPEPSSSSSDFLQVINSLPSLKELRLSDCGFHTIPDLTLNLTSLSILDFSFNYVLGPIPNAIGNMTSLKVLDLSGNNFDSSGPNLDVLKNLCNLETLDLSQNYYLSGYLPNWLGQFKSLKYLSLSSNTFYGSIPASLGKLSALRQLYLSDNQLNGTVPQSLGHLLELKELDLSQNSLKGILSEVYFAKLSRLEYLSLGSNSLVLEVGSDWIPPFQLKYIFMSSCKIGPYFPKWLQTQTAVVDLNMSNASISDSMPNWFEKWFANCFANPSSHLQLYTLDLSHNQIRGKVPKFFTSSSTTGYLWLLLNSNNFDGPFPYLSSKLTILDLSNNSISGSIPPNIGDMCPELTYFFLSNNNIDGGIPISLFTMKSLKYLDLSKNHLSGDLPQCWSNLQELEVMDLTSNHLSGVIPSSIGHMRSLKSLQLSNNHFSGKLPLALKNCTSLYILNLGENRLSGSIPAWIGNSISWLEILRLSSNMFEGSIPSQLCHLTYLQVMDLASNNLSGAIPRCFSNFSGMVLDGTKLFEDHTFFLNENDYEDKLTQIIKGRELEYTKILPFLMNMDLSSNNLAGEIPEELTRLSGIIGLNLSGNHLTGNIPETIGNMTSLESLDFSRNQLSGSIPQSMSALTYLSYLNLSYNNLSGRIPTGNQLQTLNDTSIYKGNLELCGSPFEKKCPGDEPSKAPTSTNDEKKEFKIDWFYIGMASGFILGFWGVCSILLFKKTWRYAYFRFVDDLNDRLFGAIAVKVSQLKNKLKCNQVEK